MKDSRRKMKHTALSIELKRMFPGQSGLRVRSIQRFCEAKDIWKTSKLPQESVEAVVREAIMRAILSTKFKCIQSIAYFVWVTGRTNVWTQNDSRASRFRRCECF